MQIDDALISRLKDGVKTINDQHKKIFDFTTDLFAHCVGDDEEENLYFEAVIGDAAELIKTHFKTEEELMLETKFSFYEYTDHKKEHEEFVCAVNNYIEQFQASRSTNLLMFASYVKWWVIGHIKRHDRKYINYFNRLTEGSGIEKMRV
ncbi:MAG: hemerythrin domain-containing protein [Treponema sp.]|jgi:hemerythrin|nr:hemerythrin domain-containing protein [Treponema sp.]